MDDLREFKAFGAHIVSSAARRITVAKVNRVPQAAIESIQRWSEFHQKQDTTSNDPAYMPVVIKACYAVFDYSLGWLVDITVGNIRSIAFRRTPYPVWLLQNVHQALPDHGNRDNEMSILRHKCIPMLACNLLRIFDLTKQDQEIFRLMIFLSDNRHQQLYSVSSLGACHSQAEYALPFSYSPKTR